MAGIRQQRKVKYSADDPTRDQGGLSETLNGTKNEKWFRANSIYLWLLHLKSICLLIKEQVKKGSTKAQITFTTNEKRFQPMPSTFFLVFSRKPEINEVVVSKVFGKHNK